MPLSKDGKLTSYTIPHKNCKALHHMTKLFTTRFDKNHLNQFPLTYAVYAYTDKKHLKNVGPILHCEPPHAACFTLPFTRCRYCRTPPAHRRPQQKRRQQRQRVTEGTAMAPQNGPNNITKSLAMTDLDTLNYEHGEKRSLDLFQFLSFGKKGQFSS